MNVENIVNRANLKKGMENFGGAFKMFENGSYKEYQLEERKIFEKALVNDSFFLHKVLYKIQEDNLDNSFIVNNLNKINNLGSAFILFTYLLEIKIEEKEEKLEELKEIILYKLQNSMKTIKSHYAQVYIFFNYYSLDLSKYKVFDEDSSKYSECYIKFIEETNKVVTKENSRYREKYFYINTKVSEKILKQSNDIHLKNTIIFLNEHYFENESYGIESYNLLLSKVDWNNINLYKFVKDNGLNFESLKYFFYKAQNEKEKIEISENKVMTKKEKINFLEESIEGDYNIFHFEIVNLLKEVKIEELLLKKKIRKVIYTSLYEVNSNKLDLYNFSSYEEKRKENLIYILDLKNKALRAGFLEHISLIENLIEKSLVLKSLKVYHDKRFVKKCFYKLFTSVEMLCLLRVTSERRELNKSLDLREVILENLYLKEIIKEDLIKEGKEENIINFIDLFQDYSLKQEELIEFIKKNKNKMNLESMPISFNKKLLNKKVLSKEELDEISTNQFMIRSKYGIELEKITNIEKVLSQDLDVKTEWKLRRELWSKKGHKYYKDDSIFKFLLENEIELLSELQVVEEILKEPFGSSSEENQHQIEFLEGLIKYEKSMKVFEDLKELASRMNIKINPFIKEKLYFTEVEELEEVFKL